MGLRQAFVSHWSTLHAERCALVHALQRCCVGGGQDASERPHARGVLQAHDVLRRLTANLAKDHAAGACLSQHCAVHNHASQC